jgi:hypothetical protein
MAGPRLVIPAVIDLPYTVAGKGGSSVTVGVENDGDAPLPSITWSLSGDASLAITKAPASLAPGEKAQIVVTYAGASMERIAAGTLAVMSPAGSASVPVFAASGDPALGAATWEDVIGAGGVLCGSGATIDMPAAPYPDPPSAFTDPSARVFLPEGFRDRGAQDAVVHFHGFNTTLDATLAQHLYQEQVWSSGTNAVLVVPQGPVNAASGDFGKLMSPGGLSRLLTEVLIALYRDEKIAYPVLGALALTSHSGGYRAVATNLDPAAKAPAVTRVNLFDSIYGFESTFESFALAGGLLRSNYTQNGGTLDNNQMVLADLTAKGLAVATEPTQEKLRDAPAVIDLAPSTHDGSTRIEGAFGERLRWAMPHARRGPRIELRAVTADATTATARWLSPPDEDTTGFVVETSIDGKTWSAVTKAGKDASEASFPISGSISVRVRAEVNGVDDAEVLASDAYQVSVNPNLLVVDGFDRNLDGSFGGLRHDFAAQLGLAAGKVATVSHRAITEDGFDLSSWPAVLWLLGDESTMDRAMSPAEQQAVLDYLAAGGRLVVSGSELAWSLGSSTDGAAFLAEAFGATYVSDASGSYSVMSTGVLTPTLSFTFAGAGAPYKCPYPDVLGVATPGQVLLVYGNGKTAAVGIPGRAALVGFPLELIHANQRVTVLGALFGFVGG